MGTMPPGTHGFIKTIVIIVGGAALLAYFGVTAADIIESAPMQFLIGVWSAYGAPVAMWIWEEIVVGFVWKYATIFFQSL